ncbi:MAG: 2-C-methyl-D-erythritol 2,4-cyclodiphosphate synthase [Chlorobi bacterium]|nr:2-C-methyl-D-erythritol 2,4-cyclodiphosphate synthase [Chlorobiota bacterium]
MHYRIGFGYDVHQLRENEKLIIGGIQIMYKKGTVGHSDGDVLIHAICDAILGAANLRDIGFHFPDTSNDYKGIDSKILLKKTIELLNNKAYSISNIDSTICLQKPKISKFIPEMQKVLASVIGIDKDYISIKATTTEKMGFIGKGDGISAHAVVLIEKNK